MSARSRKRTTDGRLRNAAASYVLSFEEVARLLATVSIARFVRELIPEITRTYSDDELSAMRRTGWPKLPDTLEVMGCQSTDYTCVKLISSNPGKAGPTIPTVTGTLVCTAVGTDRARLVCDATLLTPIRTAASTAVVMKELVPDIETLGVIGAGREGRSHGYVLAMTLPRVREILFFDTEPRQARRAADEVRQMLDREGSLAKRDITITALRSADSIYQCDAIVTATYGNSPVLDYNRQPMRAGTFVAAVGADLEGKRELEHNVRDHAKFIVDDMRQSLWEGELQHAITGLGLPEGTKDQWAQRDPKDRHKGTLLSGRIVSVSDFFEDSTSFLAKPQPITVYDSTGFSGQDLGLARLLLQLLEAKRWPPSAWNPPKDMSLVELLQAQEAHLAGTR